MISHLLTFSGFQGSQGLTEGQKEVQRSEQSRRRELRWEQRTSEVLRKGAQWAPSWETRAGETDVAAGGRRVVARRYFWDGGDSLGEEE